MWTYISDCTYQPQNHLHVLPSNSWHSGSLRIVDVGLWWSLDLRMIGIMMVDFFFQIFDMRSLRKGSAAGNDSLFFGFLALESVHSLMTRSVIWQDLQYIADSLSCLLAGPSDVPRQHKVYGSHWAGGLTRASYNSWYCSTFLLSPECCFLMTQWKDMCKGKADNEGRVCKH